jgi:predicted secreted protein
MMLEHVEEGGTLAMIGMMLLLALQAPSPAPSPAMRPATFAPCPTPPPRFFAVLTEMTTGAVTVPAATQFEIALKMNPSTGYGWRMTASPGVRADGSQYVGDNELQTPAPASGGVPAFPMVGGGGTQLWLFTAMQPGTATITFTLYPPGRGLPAVRKATFTVRIAPNVAVC